MTNTMPVLTEETRQALIAHANYLKQVCSPETEDYALAEIALASLEAEPVASVLPGQDVEVNWYGRNLEAGDELYKSPPVKLLKECEKCGGTGEMDSGGTQPWGDAIMLKCDCKLEDHEYVRNLEMTIARQSEIIDLLDDRSFEKQSKSTPDSLRVLRKITDNCYGVRSGFEFKWDHEIGLDGVELLKEAKQVVDNEIAQHHDIKHVGYLFVSNTTGGVVYSPAGFEMPGFTCAGKIYGDVIIQPQPSTTTQIDNDGWIELGGVDECPVSLDTRVEVKFRNGETNSRQKGNDWAWQRTNDIPGDYDIIAYRVIENDGREG